VARSLRFVQGAGADHLWILFVPAARTYLAFLNSTSLSAGFRVQTVRCFGVPNPHAKQAQSFCVPRCLTGSLQLSILSEQAGADATSCSPPERITPDRTLPARITMSSLAWTASTAGAVLPPAAIHPRSGVALEANAISANRPRQIAQTKTMVFGIIGNSLPSISTSLAWSMCSWPPALPFLRASIRRVPFSLPLPNRGCFERVADRLPELPLSMPET